MINKQKKYGYFIGLMVVLVLSGVLVGSVYQIARNRPPLVYENLTPDAVATLNRLLQESQENGGQFTNELLNISDWDNESDLGAQDSLGWKKVEDGNFIVYYKEDAKNDWKRNAELVLRLANKSIPSLKNVFGKYTYPSDINGRKLPIYLPPTNTTYGETIALLGCPGSGSGTLGITIYYVSQSGYLPKGIVLKKSVFDSQELVENSVFCVLPHELSHYVYSSLVEYSQATTLRNWVQEGVADFVASRNSQIQGSDSIAFIDQKCDLHRDFPETDGLYVNSEYWAGESFFNFVKEKFGKEKVSEFIQKTYTTSVDSALNIAFQGKDMHAEWVSSLRKSVASTAPSEMEDFQE